MKRFRLEYSGVLESLGEVAEFIQQACKALNSSKLPDDFIRNIGLVASEAVTNAIRHGTRFEGDLLAVTIEVSDELFSLRVLDHGPGFDPDAVKHPDLDKPAEGDTGYSSSRASWMRSGISVAKRPTNWSWSSGSTENHETMCRHHEETGGIA